MPLEKQFLIAQIEGIIQKGYLDAFFKDVALAPDWKEQIEQNPDAIKEIIDAFRTASKRTMELKAQSKQIN